MACSSREKKWTVNTQRASFGSRITVQNRGLLHQLFCYFSKFGISGHLAALQSKTGVLLHLCFPFLIQNRKLRQSHHTTPHIAHHTHYTAHRTHHTAHSTQHTPQTGDCSRGVDAIWFLYGALLVKEVKLKVVAVTMTFSRERSASSSNS